MVVEAERLVEEKMMESESLHGTLRKKFISVRLKEALALEEEENIEARLKVVKLEVQLAKSISEATTQAMEEFRTSPEMKDLNITFS
ncbi:hypothetical protein COCNU_contig69310783G000010 [Cocos nucifera]|nr:hypothetical protein [Cocos nucifera]